MPHPSNINDHPTILQTADSILGLERSKWIYHERALAEKLGLSLGQLRGFVQSVGKGGGNIPPPYNEGVDLDSGGDDNILHLHRMKHGSRSTNNSDDGPDEDKPSLSHVMNGESFYYQVGRKDTRDKRIDINIQKELIRMVTGTHSFLDKFGEYKTTRQKIWRHWIEDTNDFYSALYTHDHLPYIAKHFHGLWNVEVPTGEEAISTATLELVKNEIVDLFVKMYIIPSSALDRITQRRRSTRNSIDTEIVPQQERAKRQKTSPISDGSSAMEEGGEDDEEESVVEAGRNEDLATRSDVTLNTFDVGNLKELWDGGNYEQVGVLEIAAIGAHARKDMRSVNAQIIQLGGTAVSIADYDAMKRIKKTDLVRKLKNFATLREYINSKLPCGMFHIGKDQLLLEYVNHGIRYTESSGECMNQEVHFISKHNSQPELRLDCANIIRHIINCFDIPLSKFPSLMNCFGVLLFGRALRLDEFPSVATIRLHIPRLTIIDRHNLAEEDRQTFGKTKNGFHVLWYLTTDDTVQLGNQKHHAVIRTGSYGREEEDDSSNEQDDDNNDIMQQKPRFIALTSKKAVGTDADANAKLNLEAILEEMHPDILANFGGATIDGAGSAGKEIEDTGDLVFAKCEERNGIVYLRNGVEVRMILLRDFFHKDNVIINAASVLFSGDPERGNSRQFHPLQLLQSIHDIHSPDTVSSQNIINDLLEGTGITYILTTNRERPQRWRVNGLFALRILEMMSIELDDGINLLTAWAREMQLVGGKIGPDSQWMKQTAGEIAVMAQSPAIKISLAFEAELVGQYFDITNYDHAMKGEFKSRSGFTTFGLPFLLLNFMVPFWTSAAADPAKYFPRTWKLIEKLEDETLKSLKKEQLQVAIEGGLEKMLKNTEEFFKAPLIFLLLPHPVEGPRIIRMMLKILSDCADFDLDLGYEVEDSDLIDIEGADGWGQFRYTEDTWPNEERVWYDILTSDKETIENLVHFWQQLGFARNVIREELMRLSKTVQSNRVPHSKHPMKDFKVEFPIIYEALTAAFGFCPSNSRIVEMLHAFVRECIEEQTPDEFLASKLRYLIDTVYRDREERREVFVERADPKAKFQKSKHCDRKKTQQMEGQQLCSSFEKYHQSILESLPVDVQEQCKICNIRDKGVTTSEKEYEESTRKAWQQKRTKKLLKNDLLSMNTITAEAIQKRTEHDKSWQDREARKMSEVTKAVATLKHFSSVTAKHGKFHEEVFNVLTHLGVPLDVLKKKRKTHLIKSDEVVSKYLKRVKQIAKDPSSNDLTDDDLSEMSEDDILKYFVNARRSTKLQEVTKKIEDKRKLLKDLFSVAAKEISPYYKEKLENTSTQSNDEIWGGEEEDASAPPSNTDVDGGADVADSDAEDSTDNEDSNNS